MAKASALEKKLARIATLRGTTLSAADADFLRDALFDSTTYVVVKAAEIVGDSACQDFAPTLMAAFTALTENPLKSDRGCLGKIALVEALVKLRCRDAKFYRQGIKCVQIEVDMSMPGGRNDTAAAVRGICAMGLVECEETFDAQILFAELLADNWQAARIGAARAIAALQSLAGIPLLRFKMRLGDPEPAVIGACCTALLELNADISLPFVVELLTSHDEQICLEAACSLGESRRIEALEPLRKCWQRQQKSDIGGGLLSAIALLRRKEATQFLVSLIADDDEERSTDALKALAPYRFSQELVDQVEAAVNACKNRKVQQAFATKFRAS